MGFFSSKCKVCERSIKAPYNITEDLFWQNRIVAVLPDGKIIEGDYDGYGRIDRSCDEAAAGLDEAVELPKHGEPQADWYHKRCHEAAGHPGQYTGGSDDAQDQGFFYERQGETDDLR